MSYKVTVKIGKIIQELVFLVAVKMANLFVFVDQKARQLFAMPLIIANIVVWRKANAKLHVQIQIHQTVT